MQVDYSFSQRALHHIVLSSKYLKRIFFDLEASLYRNDITNIDILKPVFITGLARSGTTILLRNLYASNQFSSTTYEDMPFVLCPNLWSKFNFHSASFAPKMRLHNDRIKNSTLSPEAFEQVFWETFPEDDTEELFKIYIKLVIMKNKRNRYISKNNYNFKRIGKIEKILPEALFLITYRHPLRHALSLYEQHINFLNIEKSNKFVGQYMKYLGHKEFGVNYEPLHRNGLIYKDPNEINHWLEQWLKNYKLIKDKNSNSKKVFFVNYEKMCSEKSYWIKICEHIDLKTTKNPKTDFKNILKENTKKFDKALLDECMQIYYGFQLNDQS